MLNALSSVTGPDCSRNLDFDIFMEPVSSCRLFYFLLLCCRQTPFVALHRLDCSLHSPLVINYLRIFMISLWKIFFFHDICLGKENSSDSLPVSFFSPLQWNLSCALRIHWLFLCKYILGNKQDLVHWLGHYFSQALPSLAPELSTVLLISCSKKQENFCGNLYFVCWMPHCTNITLMWLHTNTSSRSSSEKQGPVSFSNFLWDPQQWSNWIWLRYPGCARLEWGNCRRDMQVCHTYVVPPAESRVKNSTLFFPYFWFFFGGEG